MRTRIVHPFLFVAWPLVALYVHNADHIGPIQRELGPSLVLGWSVLALGWGTLWILLHRDPHRIGVLLSAGVLLALSYGHVYDAIQEKPLELIVLGRHRYLLPLWTGLAAFAFVWSGRARQRLPQWTRALNTFSGMLVGLAVVMGLPQAVRSGNTPAPPSPTLLPNRPATVLPSIYYVILDGYARGDVLRRTYGGDNSAFLDALRQRGFYVADRSTANYSQTLLSVTSSLNLRYLDEVAAQAGAASESRAPLMSLLRHNVMFAHVRHLGYRSCLYPSGYAALDGILPVDRRNGPRWTLSGFQRLLLDTTPLRAFGQGRVSYAAHRARVRYTFAHAAEALEEDGPVFAMLHLLSPHPPFIFDAEGNTITPPRKYSIWDGNHFQLRGGTPAEYRAGYAAQHAFVSRELLAMVDAILNASTRPTIIVLQADHGPGLNVNLDDPADTDFQERAAILNAYYFPDSDYHALYPTISPVNTFRVISNQYLGGAYPLLEDRSYYSTWKQPFAFIDVTEQVVTPPDTSSETAGPDRAHPGKNPHEPRT